MRKSNLVTLFSLVLLVVLTAAIVTPVFADNPNGAWYHKILPNGNCVDQRFNSVAEANQRGFNLPGQCPAETPEPTEEPTIAPTDVPTDEPTDEPTTEPTDEPTELPTDVPTDEPTGTPPPNATPVPTDQVSRGLPDYQGPRLLETQSFRVINPVWLEQAQRGVLSYTVYWVNPSGAETAIAGCSNRLVSIYGDISCVVSEGSFDSPFVLYTRISGEGLSGLVQINWVDVNHVHWVSYDATSLGPRPLLGWTYEAVPADFFVGE